MTRLLRAVAVLVTAWLAACAAPDAVSPAAPALSWPGEPEAIRMVYVGAFSRPDDLGIGKSFLQRLGVFVFGAEDRHIVRPTAVVAVDGVYYVADPGAKGVHRFDRAGADYRLIRLADGKPLPSPVGLARGTGGAVYVTDSALAQVFVIRPQARIAEPVALQHALRQPTGVAVDPSTQRLIVTDTAAHQVLVFDPRGALAATIGERGTGDGQFNYPTLLWCDATGRLFVNDSLNFRVQIFDANGAFAGKFGRHGDAAGDLVRHKGVATDRFGHVYVVDSLLHALQVFDESGRFLLSIGGQGREPGEFWLPMGLYVGDDDMIYVADSYNQRVQIFRYVGGRS